MYHIRFQLHNLKWLKWAMFQLKHHLKLMWAMLQCYLLKLLKWAMFQLQHNLFHLSKWVIFHLNLCFCPIACHALSGQYHIDIFHSFKILSQLNTATFHRKPKFHIKSSLILFPSIFQLITHLAPAPQRISNGLVSAPAPQPISDGYHYPVPASSW